MNQQMRDEILEREMEYSSLDVANLTGVSLRQLQWWDEQSVVTPIQRGHRRLYNSTELLHVALIMRLRQKGMSLQKIRKVLHRLNGQAHEDWFAWHAGGADIYLVTDGDEVHIENSHRRIVEVQDESNQPMITVCISTLIRQLDTPKSIRKPVQSETHSVGRRRVSKAS